MKLWNTIRYWLAPETDEAIDREIDTANIRAAHRVALLFATVQGVSVTIYTLLHLRELMTPSVLDAALRVFVMVLFCLALFAVTGKMMTPDGGRRFGHRATVLTLSAFSLVMTLWGMLVSVGHYRNGEQMVTFYTVLLVTVVFFRLRPLNSFVIIGVSSAAFFAYLEWFVRSGLIQPYNYAMLILIVLGGAVVSYRMTVNNLRQTHRIGELNAALEEMVNHDSLTRLQNRYALNRRMPEYLKTDLCLAMIDIDKFKQINDTRGHSIGDRTLRTVADILTSVFGSDAVYRYGGDEFLVVVPQTEEDAFARSLAAVNERLDQFAQVHADLRVSCSYGFVRVTPLSAGAFLESITKADGKLYEHKKSKQTV